MLTDRVVLFQPVIDDDPGLVQFIDQATVKARYSKNRIETFSITVLPRTVRIDVMCIDVLFLEPFLHMFRNQFEPVVESGTHGTTVLAIQLYTLHFRNYDPELQDSYE